MVALFCVSLIHIIISLSLSLRCVKREELLKVGCVPSFQPSLIVTEDLSVLTWPPSHPPFLFPSGVAVLPQLPLTTSHNSCLHPVPLLDPTPDCRRIPSVAALPMEIWGLHDLWETDQTLWDSKTVKRRERKREGGRESEKRTRSSRRTFWISERKRKGECQTNEANQLQLFESQFLRLFDN